MIYLDVDNTLSTNEKILFFSNYALGSDGFDILLESSGLNVKLKIEDIKVKYLFRLKKLRKIYRYIPVFINLSIEMEKKFPKLGYVVHINVRKDKSVIKIGKENLTEK